MISYLELFTTSAILHILVVVAIWLRVIMMRPPTGVALAWVVLVTLLPALGATLYLLFGERRIGLRRARRLSALHTEVDALADRYLLPEMSDVDWARHPPESRMLDTLGRSTRGVPTLTRNALRLYSDSTAILRAIAADVDRAEHNVDMEFYIWEAGGEADEVVASLIRAAERGVRCRVLVDRLGSAAWLNGRQPRRLRRAGVDVRAALEVGLLRTLIARNDLRLHRKIVAIDGRVAWTGSLNLVDPRFFKQNAAVGQWIDVMVRVEGHAVLGLAAVLLADWQLETGEPVQALAASGSLDRVAPAGDADVQVISTGPVSSGDTLLQMLLGLIYAARRELVLTTPYFVPDEAMLRALRGAAARGVSVDLIVPEKNDSLLVRYASRSYYQDLIDAGVRIQAYGGGLLHTKSITVDGEMAMIGTANLDMRSLWLNYEVSLFVYDAPFTRRLRALQGEYLQDCVTVDPDGWRARPVTARFVENAVRLVSPLL